MIPVIIDGKKIMTRVKKMKIKRCMKDDGKHASIPIQTFLPFSSEDPPNVSCPVLE